MSFVDVHKLWLLVPILPALALIMHVASMRRQMLRKSYGMEKLISPLSLSVPRHLHTVKTISTCLGIACIFTALARPVAKNGIVEFPQGTTDVIILVDVSRSMAACDYKGQIKSEYFSHGTRLDMARHLISEQIIPGLGANRLGMVSYAGEAFPLAFLTNDVSAVDWVLKEALTMSSAPGDGSAMVKAFKLAFQMFDLDADDSHQKIILLLSDGGNDDGKDALTEITTDLRKRNIQLVVAGLGSTTPSSIPVGELAPWDPARFSSSEFYQKGGEVIRTALEDESLRLLANRSGGRYMRIHSLSDFSFDRLAQHLEMRSRPGQQELFPYFLVLGLVCLVLGWFVTSEIAWQQISDFRQRLVTKKEPKK